MLSKLARAVLIELHIADLRWEAEQLNSEERRARRIWLRGIATEMKRAKKAEQKAGNASLKI